MRLTLRAVAMATGMMDTVVLATALALGETVAVMPAAAVVDGADNLVVRGGEVGERSRDSGAKALKIALMVVMLGILA